MQPAIADAVHHVHVRSKVVKFKRAISCDSNVFNRDWDRFFRKNIGRIAIESLVVNSIEFGIETGDPNADFRCNGAASASHLICKADSDAFVGKSTRMKEHCLY